MEIFVLQPEGVQKYVERVKTEIENDYNHLEEIRRISTLISLNKELISVRV
ncbi:MAG: hypothetical protein IJD79_08050 [Clostridia bacterium]|nr:hypothetical protein [Clostridia bacterium]